MHALSRSGARFISTLVVLVLLFFEALELLLMLLYVLFFAGAFFLGSEPDNELGIRKADRREGEREA
jgi:hypothetical protein